MLNAIYRYFLHATAIGILYVQENKAERKNRLA
jgi:hypothetical protein